MFRKRLTDRIASGFNPESCPHFSNRQTLENGITTYWVEESYEGIEAIEEAFDASYRSGRQRPWWVTDLDFDGNIKVRVAFRNGKIFAACWNDESSVVWWDLDGKGTYYLPGAFDAEGYSIERDWLGALKDPLVSKDNLFKLDDDELPSIEVLWKQAEAFHNEASFEVLEELAKSSSFGDRYAAASSQKTPVDLLELLACDEENSIRWAVLKNTSFPLESFVVPARCDNPDVRKNVAASNRTPVKLLVELSKDAEDSVRWEVAGNRNAPEETLERLSRDKCKWVRYGVAENPFTPREILERLMENDPDAGVRNRAKENLGID